MHRESAPDVGGFVGVEGRTILPFLAFAVLAPTTLALARAGGTYFERRGNAPPGTTDARRPAPPSPTPAAGSPPTCSPRSFAHGMARGHELMAEGHFDHAARAFDEAVRARPFDADARAERAHARLLAGKGTHEELEIARALAREDDLIGRIELDQGMLFDREGDAEDARVSFVRAERHGSRSAAEKLGESSRCTVSAEAGGDPIAIDPRKRPATAPPLLRDGDRWLLRLVAPEERPGSSGAVEGFFSDHPARYLFDGHRWTDDAPSCTIDEEHCSPDGWGRVAPRGREIRRYVDGRGRALVTAVLDEGDASRVRFAFAGRTLHVTGGGCSLSVPF